MAFYKNKLYLLLIGVLLPLLYQDAFAESLEDFALKCDTEIGVSVPDFICDNGSKVPTTNYSNGLCDRPNQLNQECDPDSRFQVLVNTASAYVVAHCRKKGLGTGLFGDIAVIQHNKINGATCFYQGALGSLSKSGNVKAPSKGVGNPAFWMTPSAIASSSFPCVSCHDNGPLIRSPYLSQLSGSNKLPGAQDTNANRNQPYYFVGSDFADWKAYRVEVAGNFCLGCHRLGISNQNGSSETGTALDFSIRSIKGNLPHKNPLSSASPLWMLYGQTSENLAHQMAAYEIRECARNFDPYNLPNSNSCRIKQFSGKASSNVPGTYTAVWRKNTSSEIQVYGWSYRNYRQKYDQLWKEGWRLASLQPYVINGNVLYNAVWRPSTAGEIQVYGYTYADYRAKYDAIWPQGWRLKILRPYVVNGAVRYTAVWKRSRAAETQVYGYTYTDFRSTYDRLWPKGWRLKSITPYVINNNVRYTAVWEANTSSEIQVYGWTYADYRAKYDRLWNQGWRLAFLEPYVVGGRTLYTAVWRPSRSSEIQLYGANYETYRKKYDELWPQGWRLKVLRTY